MKKTILTFILCLSAAGPSFAQNNMEAMRFLTINALVQYGEKLYDRGDFDGACSVFNHVLTFDSHQVQALEYLKDMGHSPAPIPIPVPVSVPQSRVSKPFVPVRHIIVVRKSAVDTVDIADTENLKKAIEAKKQVIEKLRVQVMQMKANLASQSVKE